MPQPSLARAKTLSRWRVRSWAAVVWAGTSLVVAALGFAGSSAKAQPGDAVMQAAPAPARQTLSKPLWRDLTARQQRALHPLASHWDSLSEPHKRKWLALSRNYAKMPAADQEILHSRMTEWAALTNQQRAQARLNFAEVKDVPIDERKAKWEAYQALSEEEKGRLAARAAPRPHGAAPTIRPVPAQKLAPVPPVSADGQHTARIQLAPSSPARPLLFAPAPTAAPIPSGGAPVSPEAQVPALSTLSQTPAPAETPAPAIPPVRVTEQPSSAP